MIRGIYMAKHLGKDTTKKNDVNVSSPLRSEFGHFDAVYVDSFEQYQRKDY